MYVFSLFRYVINVGHTFHDPFVYLKTVSALSFHLSLSLRLSLSLLSHVTNLRRWPRSDGSKRRVEVVNDQHTTTRLMDWRDMESMTLFILNVKETLDLFNYKHYSNLITDQVLFMMDHHLNYLRSWITHLKR